MEERQSILIKEKISLKKEFKQKKANFKNVKSIKMGIKYI